MQYTITVSGAELEVLSLAIGRMPTAKPIVARQPKAVASRPTGPNPWQETQPLDDASAEWIRKRETRNFTPRYPKFAPSRSTGPTRWTNADRAALAGFNELAVVFWRRLGHEVVISGPFTAINANGANVSVRPLTTTN